MVSSATLTINKIKNGFHQKSLEILQFYEQSLHRISKEDPKIHSFLYLEKKASLLPKSKNQILEGIPIGIKDNIATEGMTTTCGSRILEGYIPPYDATVIQKLRSVGALPIGKTNMDEFAMGSTTETSAYGVTRNPWNTSHVPGGSSGGSAAAVAANLVSVALGSDTGGSIRNPASYCGITGVKPTYGLVSRYGLIAYACSLEQIGVLAHSAEECAHVLQCIAGKDPFDSTTRESKEPLRLPQSHSMKLRIGIPEEFLGEGVDPHVKREIQKCIQDFESMNAKIDFIKMPDLKYALPAYYIIAMAEASSNLARFDGVKYGPVTQVDSGDTFFDFIAKYRATHFGEEVKKRILIGSFTLSSGYYDQYYAKAMKVRKLITDYFTNAFNKYDLIFGPTVPNLPFQLNEELDDPLALYLCDVFTVPVNLAGLPAISFPCGFHEGLPIGAQLIAPEFQENLLFDVVHAYQQITDYHTRSPAGFELEGLD